MWCQGVTDLAKLSMLTRGDWWWMRVLLPSVEDLAYLEGTCRILLSGPLMPSLCCFLEEGYHLQ